VARGRRTDGFPADALISRHYVVYLGVWLRLNQGNSADGRSGDHISITATEDPFLGSGTTLAAAEMAGRVCLGMELDPRYVDVCVRRWQDLAGKQAVLEGDGRTFAEIARKRRREAA